MLTGPIIRRNKRVASALGAALMLSIPFTGCLDNEIVKRFREAAAPGIASGLSNAVETPGSVEAGLREAWAALFDGLGAVIDLKDSSSTSGS